MADGAIRPPKPLQITADSKELWEDWLQSYNWFAEAVQLAKKPQNVQVATFMTSIGRDAQQVFKTFNLSEDQQKDLTVIKNKFSEYFTPKVNYTFERYKFNQMKQLQGECFKDFLTRVKIQASRCKFSVIEDELLRDKIVVGIESNDVREKLLSDFDLNLDKAIQMCLASENASHHLKNMVNDNSHVISTLSYKNSNVSKNVFSKGQNQKFTNSSQPSKIINDCRNCGNSHKLNQCPAFGKQCSNCKKLNHFAKKCRSKSIRKYKVQEIEKVDTVDTEETNYIIGEIKTNNCDDWLENVIINNKCIPMKLDTGAQCNAVPYEIAKSLKLKIQPSTVKKLLTYSGHSMEVAGESVVPCLIKNKEITLRLIIAHGGISPVLGRKTCSEAGLIKRLDQINTLVEEFSDLFRGMGCIKNFEYTADFSSDCLKTEIKPPRKIPFTLKPTVKNELDKMVQDKIIRKIDEPTPIASPMVIAKQKGKIRICIDPSEVNKILLRRHYPLKTLDELTANIKNSKYFTKLDLKKGFWQLKVSPTTQPYLTFTTPWGRYCFLRVPFGIKSAPEIFQDTMTKILKGIPGVENSMDDIFIHAPDVNVLRERTKIVLQSLRDAGAKLNEDKCEFEKEQIKFLGHILSKEGIKIDPEKVETIDRIKSPSSKKDLQRLLGMIQYLHKFIPNLSDKTHNMRLLLKKNTTWCWNDQLEKEFSEIKEMIKNAPTLSYFDPNKELTISVDSSSFALGAVLLQEGNPIAYSSTALNSAQQLYPQIEKEALAMKFGCKKFHQYIYGKNIIIETDHKPLESIFNKSIDRIPPRLQKIFFEIQQYGPKVHYKRGKELHIADLLSRDCQNKDTAEESDLQVLFAIPTSNECLKTLQNLTSTDPELSLIKHFISTGWPQNKDYLPDSCKKYLPFADELSVQKDLVFKGLRIIIPEKYRTQALKNLHVGHLGISSCLRRARDCMFWPGMSQSIIAMIENCETCQRTQKAPPTEHLLPKEIPTLPWEILASDVFTFHGNDYLLITDSYSGFIDFKPLKDSTSSSIIEIFKDWFSVHGIPRILEIDNAPYYSSAEFKLFSEKWMFRLQTSSPLYPKSNGLAERAVQTAKNLLKKCKLSGQDIHLALLNFRNTPRENMGSPAQRLYSRRTRTTVPVSEELLKPSILQSVTEQLAAKRLKQKYYHDLHSTSSDTSFTPNQNVMLKKGNRDWIPAKIISKAAPRSYNVMTPTGEYRRNTSYIRPTQLKFTIEKKREMKPGVNLQPKQPEENIMSSNDDHHLPPDKPPDPLPMDFPVHTSNSPTNRLVTTVEL